MGLVVEMRAFQSSIETSKDGSAGSSGAVPQCADNVVRLWNLCPRTSDVTGYDLRNMSLFSLLLEAECEGASREHMARTFFHLRVDRDRTRALSVVETHLARAHWLKKNGFPFLDW